MLALARDYGDDDGSLDQESEELMQEMAVAVRESDVDLVDLNAGLGSQFLMDVESTYTSYINNHVGGYPPDLEKGLYDDGLVADIEPGRNLIEPLPLTSRHDQTDSSYEWEYSPLVRDIMEGPWSRPPVPDRQTVSSQQCSVCGASFEGKLWTQAYRRHMQDEHGGKYACTAAHCRRVFRRSDALRQHKRRHHAGELDGLQILPHKSIMGKDPKQVRHPIKNQEPEAHSSGQMPNAPAAEESQCAKPAGDVISQPLPTFPEPLSKWIETDDRDKINLQEKGFEQSRRDRGLLTEQQDDTSTDYARGLMESPGPGIGQFFMPDGLEEIKLENHFNQQPLRLTADYKHSRGEGGRSHLIADDVDSMDWKSDKLFFADTPYDARPMARTETDRTPLSLHSPQQPDILTDLRTRTQGRRAKMSASDTLPIPRWTTKVQSVSRDYLYDSKRQNQSLNQGLDSKDPAVVSCANLREENSCPAAPGYTREFLCLIMDTSHNKYTLTISNITLYVSLPVLVTAAVFRELLISPECPWIMLPVVSIMTFWLNILMERIIKGYVIPSMFLQRPESKFGLWYMIFNIFEYLTLPSIVSQTLYASRPKGVDQLFVRPADSVYSYVFIIVLQELLFWADRVSDHRLAYERLHPNKIAKPSTKDETRLWTRSLKGLEHSACRVANHLWLKIHESFYTVMSAVGCIEPPLARGYLRLRWTCKCGDAFWSDVTEYGTGGARKVAERIVSVAGVQVTVTSYNATSTNQKWTFQIPRWIRNLMWISGARANNQPKLPQHCPPTPTSSSTTSTRVGTSSSVGSSLRLLACIHRTQDHMHLLQEPIDQVDNDLSLFQYMEKQLKQHRRRIRQLLSLRSVRGVHLVKFHLRTGNFVEVREHKRYCTTVAPPNIITQTPGLSNNSAPCNCFPPEPKSEPAPNAEYRCTIDEQDLGAGPPVDPKFLLHMLKSRSCINQDSKSIFNILPRRICGQLNGGDLKPAVGWGIYYEEGLNADVVINIALAILVLGSLLFGILWSVLEMDIQGAFGVSSYMVTASGIVIAWVASQAKNFG